MAVTGDGVDQKHSGRLPQATAPLVGHLPLVLGMEGIDNVNYNEPLEKVDGPLRNTQVDPVRLDTSESDL